MARIPRGLPCSSAISREECGIVDIVIDDDKSSLTDQHLIMFMHLQQL